MNESTVATLIREHLARHLSEGETLKEQPFYGDKRRYYLDFFLEEGSYLLGLPPRTGIEIKQRLVSDTLMRLHFVYDSANLAKMILVLIDEGEVDTLKKRISIFHKGSLKGRDIQVVKLREILILGETPEYANAKLEEQIVNENDEEISIRRLDNLKKSICSNTYTLFFGAGVSCSAGKPGWDALLKAILRNAVKQSGLNMSVRDYKRINDYPYCSNSPLIVAQYLCSCLPNDTLSSLVRKEIYRKETTSFSLIDALIALVQCKRPESVITYNYDNLFEQRANNKGLMTRSISNDNRVEGEELPVYHVHGVLPQDDIHTGQYRIVLDEKSYHEESRDVFLWSNIEQMHALRRSTCLFVGLSMTDPNLRRLLEISHQEYGDEPAYHYAFLKKEPLKKGEERKNRDNQRIIEDILKNLGVVVIWYNEHDDLPKMIRKLMV